MGIKPPFSAVPMTDAQHKAQSHGGEQWCVGLYAANIPETMTGNEWFEDQAQIHLDRWISERKMSSTA